MSESGLGKRFHHHVSFCTFPILYHGPGLHFFFFFGLHILIKFNKTKKRVPVFYLLRERQSSFEVRLILEESSEQAFEFKQRQSQNPIPEGKLGGGEKQNYPYS